MVTNNTKQRLSISVNEETVKIIENSVKEGLFRNKSHAVEFSINESLNTERYLEKLKGGLKDERQK